MNRTRLSALAAAAALGLATLTSCGDSAPRVAPSALARYSIRGTFTAVDVRGREAYDRGHLPNAAHMENWIVPPELDETPKEEPLVVYGAGDEGRDEEMAAAALVKAGFKKVSILKGGMASYSALKLPTESKEDEERAREMIEGFRQAEKEKQDLGRHFEKTVEKARKEFMKSERP